MKKLLYAHLCMGVANIIFGINVPVSKSILANHLDGVSLSFLRMAFAAAAFWLLSLFVPREKVRPRDMALLLVAGLFGVAVNQFLFVQGLSYTSPTDAVMVITITPVLVMCLAAAVLREPITGVKVVGVLLGAGGALMIILHGGSASFGGEHMRGNLMCFFSSLSYAIYLIISKPIMARYSATTVMRWMFLFSAVAMLPISLRHVQDVSWQAIPMSGYAEIFFTLCGATFLTYLCIGYALRSLRPTTLSTYNYVQPLVASMAAVAMGLDSIGWYKLGAAALIFAGVYLVTKSRARAKPYN
ncbi:MAG: DMT family transporter [Prevotellaceae bacterium]|jgi:drug/metabolite transporter (DMT)-like permease|nr:DMT family transporter [Prevotellaceae bacterium]